MSDCDCDCVTGWVAAMGKGCDIYDCRLHMRIWAVGVAFGGST